MRVFEGMRVRLRLFICVVSLLDLLLLGNSGSFLPLLARKLSCFDHAFLLGSFFEVCLFLRFELLLAEFLLSCRGSFGSELLKFLLLLGELHMCLLLLDQGLHLGWLKPANI